MSRVVVETVSGRVSGTSEAGLSVFRGIPYAAAPVGDLRFRAPVQREPWLEVRDASEFGPAPTQNPNRAIEALWGSPGLPQDEDCLMLNIWTPAADDRQRPVMVWIHGGAYAIGSGGEAIYDGAALAERGDVVVVTINYRLGALGFLCLPGLGDTNVGLRDQFAALRWVSRNIAAFGGDPDNVTVFGESAGAMSAALMLVSPQARGLVHRAILQSGAGHTGISLEAAHATGRRFADKLGIAADDFDAIRTAPVEDLLWAQRQFEAERVAAMVEHRRPSIAFQPIIDGDLIPRRPIDDARTGNGAGIPTLVGWLDEEMKLFAFFAKLAQGTAATDPSEVQTVAYLDELHGDGRRAYDAYRDARSERGEPATPAEIFSAAGGDASFGIPGEALLDAQSQHEPRTYAYLMDWRSPAYEGALGSCHTLDIPFVFGTRDRCQDFAGTGAAADRLEDTMMDAWIAFARTGDPSTDALDWPAYSREAPNRLMLGERIRVEQEWRAAERAVWSAVL